MDVRALVCTLGAAGVISCGSGITAEEIRNSGRIPLPPSAASPPQTPSRVESCLEMGAARLGGLSVTATSTTFDLATLSCEDCRVAFALSVPDGWAMPGSTPGKVPPLETLRVGYLYGSLTLYAPSDSVLEKIRDLCSEWSREPSYAPACDWKNVRGDEWVSGSFAARIIDGEPYIAHVRFDAPATATERRLPVDRFPSFAGPLDLQVDTNLLSIIAAVYGFSGWMGFAPDAVEVVEPFEGKLLGCLPVVQ